MTLPDIGEGSTNNTAVAGAGSSRGKKKKKIVGASISLSPVSKYVASFLVKHMVSIVFLALNDTMQSTCHACFIIEIISHEFILATSNKTLLRE